MGLNRELRRLLFGLMIAFAVVALSATYWAVLERDRLLGREDNPRLLEARAAIQRGAIYDRAGELLAVSDATATRFRTRRYPHPEVYSAVGYYSLRYGASGIEDAFEVLLSGSDRARTLEDYMLQAPQIGQDIQVSLDLTVQQAVDRAMRGLSGAVVVMSVPDGQLLALLSAPTYDPNMLDQDWETLRAAPGNPFFNRPFQGRYQPGSALQTPLVAALLLRETAMTTAFPDADAPVQIDNLTLTCAAPPPAAELTLSAAYAYACPMPFARLAEALPEDVLAAVIDIFRVTNTVSFVSPAVAPPPTAASPAPSPTITEANLIETALGQGRLTVSPLSMAMLAAAVINDGNSPQPQMLLATHPPGAEWRRQNANAPSLPLMTQTGARQLQELMRLAVTDGAAFAAERPGIDIGGHAAQAFAGETSLAWFIGFMTMGADQDAVVAVVIESSASPALAADVGGTALAAARAVLQNDAGLPPFPQSPP